MKKTVTHGARQGATSTAPSLLSPPRRANGIATRARLFDVASEQFALTGYGGTSLRKIAAAANVDLATLKYHFGDKATLFGEVYRVGHAALLELLVPIAESLSVVENIREFDQKLTSLVSATTVYLKRNQPFIRMHLFRLLEKPTEIIPLEKKLEEDVLSLMESTFEQLRARGIVRAVDTRAVVVLLVTALPTWYISAQAKPDWLRAQGDAEKRFEAFFLDLLRQLLRSDGAHPDDG